VRAERDAEVKAMAARLEAALASCARRWAGLWLNNLWGPHPEEAVHFSLPYHSRSFVINHSRSYVSPDFAFRVWARYLTSEQQFGITAPFRGQPDRLKPEAGTLVVPHSPVMHPFCELIPSVHQSSCITVLANLVAVVERSGQLS
jgi:hypothetical protein